MPVEKPFQPPLRKPVPEYQTPAPTVVFYSEVVDNLDPAYQANAPMQRGRLYSTIQNADPNVIAAYPNLYFLRETKFRESDRYVIWAWTTVPEAEDTYNAEIDYVSDFVAAPRFTRVYTVRRDQYEASPSIVEGSPLTGIIGIEVANGGAGYLASDTIDIDSTSGSGAAAELVVDSNGVITNVIVTSEGSGYTSPPTITVVTATGAGAELVAQLQPSNAVLITQRKSEFPEDNVLRNEFVRVARIYETLPGPFITTYRVDEDGATITVQRRHQYQTVIDAISPKETLITGVWTRISSEPVNESYFVGWEVHESRPIPGNVMTETKLFEDGSVITVTRQMVPCSGIITSESIIGGFWTKEYGQPVSDLVCMQIIETMHLPGNPMVSTKLDNAGNVIDIVRTIKDTSTITTSESITGGGVWLKVTKESVSDLVAWEVDEAMQLPGNLVPSVEFDAKGEEIIKETNLAATVSIAPSQSELAGVIHTTEYSEVSDLVSHQEVSALQWLDEAYFSLEIPNLIPEWARPQIPTIIESHTVAGTAALPTLGPGEFQASERQLTKLLFERRSTHIPSVSFPITATNEMWDERYGGAILTETITLDESPFIPDSGLFVVESETKTLAVYTGGPPTGLYMKRTLANLSPPWPTITTKKFDDEMQVYSTIDEQVVDPSYAVTSGTYFVESLEKIDEVRSKRIKLTRQPTAIDVGSALQTERWHPFQFPGLLTPVAVAGVTTAYYVRRTRAELCQQIIKTWWLSSVGKPTIAVDEIVMDNIIISTLNNVTVLAYSGECLHDALTTFGVLFWPATTPDYTTYTGSWIGISKVVAATIEETNIPNLWKIQTVNVVMR